MRRAVFASVVLCLFATRSFAADEIRVKETYWQALAGLGGVTLDSDRNPVYHTKDRFYFPKTGKWLPYHKDASWGKVFIDRSGRVWGLNYHQSQIHLWTGTAWEKYHYHPVKLFEDSAGRVFLFDGSNVRVLGPDGKWAAQPTTQARHYEDVNFVESGKRVWLWGSREKPGSLEGMLGVWSYADGKWTHHTTKDGLPFDSVKWMHPLADGRFLMIQDRPPNEKNLLWNATAYWHPDRKLADDEKAVFAEKDLLTYSDPSTGIDGTLYVQVYRGKKGEYSMVAIDQKGKVHGLTKDEVETFRRQPQAMIQRQYIVFAKLGDPLPVVPSYEGDFICADREGRLYYRQRAGADFANLPVTVVWPKHEKPGEVMRLAKEPTPVTRIVRDDVGKIWAEPVYGGGLLQWHGGKWIDTPVQPLYHPLWTARPASPWNDWTWHTGHLFRLHGKNGSLLVVRLRDVYQSEEPPKERMEPGVIINRAGVHPALPPRLPKGVERSLYWLEAWLFRDGKWTGPVEIRKLLATESAALVADFPTSSGEMSYFTYAHDGDRVWAAFDGKLLTADKTGKVTEADWPRDKPKHPLPFVMLSKLPNGKVLLSGTLGDGHTLALTGEGKVAAEDFKMPQNSPAVNAHEALAHWKLAKDGTLWYWTTVAKVWHFRDGKWTEKKGLGAPMYEDADGNFWCWAEPRYAGKYQLFIANGTATKDITFERDDWRFGFSKVPKGTPVWALSDRFVWFEPSAAGGKPVMHWRVLSEPTYGHAPAVIDDKRNVLLGHWRGTLK